MLGALLSEQKEGTMLNRAVPKKINILIAVAAAVLVMAGAGIWAYTIGPLRSPVHTVANAQHQLTELSYHGRRGYDALTLLRQYADVQAKHYSFGDMVVAINGSVGDGPKYWTFYVNGKEASIGAGTYQTKDTDTIMWRLQ